jgi:hypothetical protein
MLASAAWADSPLSPAAPPGFESPKPQPYSSKDADTIYVGQIVQNPQTGKNGGWNLKLETADDSLCSNAHINAVSAVNGDHVTVDINKTRPILQPSVCMTNFAPATFWTSLPAFGKPLTLDIVNGENDDRYKITFATNGASVTTIHAGFTIFRLDDKK